MVYSLPLGAGTTFRDGSIDFSWVASNCNSGDHLVAGDLSAD
ncbi:11337_t:CDS:2 [Ambispora leptoticha]|uniref:11337_t:CDS:1 n=1 Tax=Ambispora leptoticha TaxID=144679 RepID=A0A9N8WJ00_9GLOM|nr:11337_t:CDS:2 [Ambispora leptoticha]